MTQLSSAGKLIFSADDRHFAARVEKVDAARAISSGRYRGEIECRNYKRTTRFVFPAAVNDRRELFRSSETTRGIAIPTILVLVLFRYTLGNYRRFVM